MWYHLNITLLQNRHKNGEKIHNQKPPHTAYKIPVGHMMGNNGLEHLGTLAIAQLH